MRPVVLWVVLLSAGALAFLVGIRCAPLPHPLPIDTINPYIDAGAQ